MSDIMIERLKESVGKRVLIFLHNNFRYAGKVTNCDDVYLEIFDDKIQGFKVIEVNQIKEVEVKE